METQESCMIEQKSSCDILSASELVRMKKSNDEPTRYNIGEKFYKNQNSWLENKAVDCALENFAEALKQYRAARKCDLIQAEWDEELNASVTTKLKGKFLQHMGCAHSGKILLSPEESIFLLENGCIEILNGKMPLSTEEAYKVMLKGNLSEEKYQVYSQLSQLGFLVVPHRKDFGGKAQNKDSHQAKRKRKASPEMYKSPEKKRTSFLGALSNLPDTSACSVEKENSVHETSTELASADSSAQDCVQTDPLPSSNDKCNTIENSNVCSEVKEMSENILSQPSSEVDMEEGDPMPSVSKDLPESASSNVIDDSSVHNNSSTKENIQEESKLSVEETKVDNVLESNDHISESETSVQMKDTDAESCCDTNSKPVLSIGDTVIGENAGDSEKSNITPEINETVSENNISVHDIANSELSHDASLNPDPVTIKAPVCVVKEDNKRINTEEEPEDYVSDEENFVEVESSNTELSDDNSNPDTSNFESPVRVSNRAIDIMTLDSQNTEASEPSGSLRNNVSSSNINVNPDDSSCSVMEAGSHDEDSGSDVMSCSSSDALSLCDDSQLERLEDNEVELVAVTKKEKKPLAVIDLLSEGDDSKSENSCSDDEIQVVKICENAHSNDTHRSSVIRATVKCKKEEKIATSSLDERAPCIKFPDCVKKNMLVVIKPPSIYLPPNVAMSKESYVLSFAPCRAQAQRVWNSYRDLEDFRRQRTEGVPPRNARESFNRNRVDSSNNYEMGSSNLPQDSRRSNINPWVNNVGNSNQRNSPQSFSNFQNSDQRPWMHENLNGSQGPNFFNRRSMYNEPGQNPNYMPPDMRSSLPRSTAINSVVSVSNQDMNVSMVGNHILHPPQVNPNSLLPGFNANLAGLGPMDLMAAVQRTAYNVATDVLSSMLGANMTSHMMPHMPSYGSTFPPVPNGSYRMPAPVNLSYNAPSFNGDQGFVNRRREQYRRHRVTNPFPCQYRNVSNKGSWNEIRQAVGETEMEVDVGSDVEEVPISAIDVLWDSKGICPLVKAGFKYQPSEVLKKLKITQMANLLSNSLNNQENVSSTSCLEISFDVYLPGTNYRKTCPGIPKHRIVVFRSTDPPPKNSDIVFLQRKWNDGATLQFAVVDHGDISFYSFNSIYLPVDTPHEN